jgi:hypothetical protein
MSKNNKEEVNAIQIYCFGLPSAINKFIVCLIRL